MLFISCFGNIPSCGKPLGDLLISGAGIPDPLGGKGGGIEDAARKLCRKSDTRTSLAHLANTAGKAVRGFDVGIESMERAPIPFGMYFRASDDYTLAALPEGSVLYNVTPKAGATVDSEFILCPRGLGVLPLHGMEGYPRFPAIYRYENAAGMKFAVLTFIPETVATKSPWTPGIFRNYRLQSTLGEIYSWLAGKPLPAMCYGAPGAYILAKREGDRLSVGLWNIFADEILSPVIALEGVYTHLDIHNAKGHLEGDRLIIEEDIPPYGFLFFTVSK